MKYPRLLQAQKRAEAVRMRGLLAERPAQALREFSRTQAA